jgi:hypothetical protein
MDINSLLRNKQLDPSEIMDSLWNEMWKDAYSAVFCDHLDRGLDPGFAASKADDDLFALYSEGLDLVATEE